MIVDLGGRLYAIDLTVARQVGGRRVDEGDLLSVDGDTLTTDLWLLEGDDIHTRFQIMRREIAERFRNARWPLM